MLVGHERRGAGKERRFPTPRFRHWSRRVVAAGKRRPRDEQNSGRRYWRHSREAFNGRRRTARIRFGREHAARRFRRQTQRDNARLDLRKYLDRLSVGGSRRQGRERTETSRI